MGHTVLAVGLVGALLLWVVNTQVSSLRVNDTVLEDRLEIIQSDLKTNAEILHELIKNQRVMLAALRKNEEK